MPEVSRQLLGGDVWDVYGVMAPGTNSGSVERLSAAWAAETPASATTAAATAVWISFRR